MVDGIDQTNGAAGVLEVILGLNDVYSLFSRHSIMTKLYPKQNPYHTKDYDMGNDIKVYVERRAHP